jgi:beta-glucanase (GH16 family)
MLKTLILTALVASLTACSIDGGFAVQHNLSVLHVNSSSSDVSPIENQLPPTPTPTPVPTPVPTPLPTPAPSAVNDIDLSRYTLTFSDEFNSLSLSTMTPKGSSTWYYLPPYGAAGFYSDSIWDASVMSVSNGALKNSAYLDSSGKWHSGNISSMDEQGNGFAQQYGYFEARVKMPSSGTGAWPAFWLQPTNSIPALGKTNTKNLELDIFEWYGVTFDHNEPLIQQASHNWNPDGSQAENVPFVYVPATPIPNGALPWQDYHNYGLLITPQTITWYIDGVQTNQMATPTDYMSSPFYIMIDYAIGGGWPLSGMVNNSDLSVDWVRVYALPK